ncbi:putative ferruginol synthase [Helianthus annuus]|nr:putative ferruginol synthase [Helianthus annuus]
MELLYLIITSIISFFFLLHVADVHRKRRLPPGPLRLPIIGNLHQLLGPKPHKTLATLAKKHGPLMTIQLGNITTMVASTPEAAREILLSKDEVCSSRPVPDAVTALKHHDMAILWIPPNVTWQTHRKVLRMYLTSQHKLDTLKNVRETVVEEMLDYIRVCARKKAAVDIGMMGFAFSLNQLVKTFFSQNMTSYEPEDIRRFQEVVEAAMEMMGKLNIVDMFPVLKPFDPQNVRRRAKEAFVSLEEMVEAPLNERVKHRDSNLPRFDDVLDSMLDYSEENEDEFSLKHIKMLLMEVLVAGTDTIASSTTWIMSELLLNPHMLLKVREEVSHIVGEDGTIEEAKTLELPYLHAVIKETLRLHAGSPLLAPHITQTEVQIGNYVVPKNTRLLVNAWAVARDERYWENPSVFMPERFLKNKVDFKGQHFEFIPFGSGRRKCPGMPLAERMLSLIVASFVYHFDWDANEEVNMDDKFGLALLKATPLVVTPQVVTK